MESTRLFLIRHGTTDANQAGVFLGRTDAPLNDVGIQEAARLGERLGNAPFDAIVSSDLRRARATADAIARGRPVREEPRLREMDLGAFDGRVAAEVHAEHAALIQAWRTDPTDVRMPGGETLAEVQARAVAALDDLAAAHPGGTVAVVTHTFVLLSVTAHVLGLPLATFRRLFVDRASISLFEWRAGRGAVLRRFNDTAHLEP